jgi:hypothetical protein
VLEISHEGDGVVVRCKDGSKFQGDLVIGADGIHSRTRVEMQRFAEETGPTGLMDRDKSCKSSERSICNYQSLRISGFKCGSKCSTVTSPWDRILLRDQASSSLRLILHEAFILLLAWHIKRT